MKLLKGLIGIMVELISNIYIIGMASVITILWIAFYEGGTPDVFSPYYFAGTVAFLWLIFFSRKQIFRFLK